VTALARGDAEQAAGEREGSHLISRHGIDYSHDGHHDGCGSQY